MAKKEAIEQIIGDLHAMPVEVLTPTEMARADRLTIDGGIPGFDLMLAAGRAVADTALRHGGRHILVLAGPGNNGGDGLVAARALADAGRQVEVALLGSPDNLTGDAATAFASYGGVVHVFDDQTAPALDLGADLIIDALFGAGLSRGLSGPLGQLVERANEAPAEIIAVDLPSGVNGASGAVAGQAVKADRTVTFFRLKPGHLLYPGRSHCGETELAQIGIEDRVLGEIASRTYFNREPLWRAHLPVPGPLTHKYHRGHALIVSGPWLNTGASRLAAGAALRIGAGLVTLAAEREAARIHAAHVTAIMLRQAETSEDLETILSDSRISSVLIGPAAGLDVDTAEKVAVCLRSAASTVLDADALSVFADDRESLFRAIVDRAAPTVLTPHAGEFARLFPDLAGDRLMQAEAAAARSGAIIVLKGADTVVADPAGPVSISANAPPWLATAGAGDILAGMVAGLLAQGMPAFHAASAAVWMHGEAANAFGPGLTADDLSGRLPEVLEKFQ